LLRTGTITFRLVGMNLAEAAARRAVNGNEQFPPHHPQTNGIAERFNGRISDIVSQTCLGSAAVPQCIGGNIGGTGAARRLSWRPRHLDG
jgi:hypothetical protein